jgi:hypothetical protein
MRAITVLAAIGILSACTAPLVVDEQGRPLGFARGSGSRATDGGSGRQASSTAAGGAAPEQAERPATVQREEPLLGWNGGVVLDGAPTQQAPDHGIEPGQGRMRIIELYQQVLDERDALRDELEATADAMEAAQRQRIELEEENRTLRERVVELENAQASMQAENLDLAARLTTAQIRRLEAERLLLETKIADLRAREQAARETRPAGVQPAGAERTEAGS